MGQKNFRRIRTVPEKKARALREGKGNVQEGWRERKKREWEIGQLIRIYGGLCFYCKEAVELGDEESPMYATRDHFIPPSKGGEDTIDNLRLACHVCNQEKSDQLWKEGARAVTW